MRPARPRASRRCSSPASTRSRTRRPRAGQGEGTTYAELGAKGEFTVTGAASDAELPTQPATLAALDDGADEYGFEFKDLKAGANKVRFENRGEEPHHAIMFPIAKGRRSAKVMIDELVVK